MIQARNGKAFEYVLLDTLNQMIVKRNPSRKINIIKDNTYDIAYKHFGDIEIIERDKYNLVAKAAIGSIIDLEPRLTYSMTKDDCLIIKLQKDNKGQEGDVRDIVSVSSKQNWEIGISAKNNHAALKHSRLSNTINFGERWLGISNSNIYFDGIRPIFDKLCDLKKEKVLWRDIESKEDHFYLPLMLAFKKELETLYINNPKKVASNMFRYLIGKQDFYKVIKRKTGVEIQIYNIYGTLNQSSNDISSYIQIPKLKIPHIITDINFKKNSKNTLIVTFYPEWRISLRIHSASTKVEPSLKFDTSLVSVPEVLHTIVHKY